MYVLFQETLEYVFKIVLVFCLKLHFLFLTGLLCKLFNAYAKLWRENKEYHGIFLEKKCELHRNEKLEPLSRSTGKASRTFLSKQSMDENNDQSTI